MGVLIASATRDELEDYVIKSSARGAGGWIITANLDHVRRASRDQHTRQLLSEADLRVADGAPIVWAARLIGAPLPERVAGSDLIYTLTAKAAAGGLRVFLLGGKDDETARRACSVLRGKWPALDIAFCAPDIQIGNRESACMEYVFDALRSARPKIVFVGLGFPKQDLVIRTLRTEFPHVWFLGCGVSIEFAAGSVRRAPVALQKIGAEWVYRLIQEPTKLFRRYLIHGLPFAARLIAWAIGSRLRTVFIRHFG